MYGQHTQLAQTGAAVTFGGLIGYTSLGLALVTVGFILGALYTLGRRRKHPRP